MPVRIPIQQAQIRVSLGYRTLSGSVIGGDNLPAVGRKIIVLGRTELRAWIVVAETVTDGSGNYSVTIPAGGNDRFIIVGIGDTALGEYSDILSDVTGVL